MTFNDKYRIFYVLILSSIPLGIFVAFQDTWWYLIFSLLWWRIMGSLWVQIGLHRYFTHRSFKTGPLRHKFLAIGTVLTGNGSIIVWATHHVHHHVHSDTTYDPHSPKEGWLHTILTWPMASLNYFVEEKKIKTVPKYLLKDQLIVWLHNNYFLLWTFLIFIICLVSWKLALFGLIMPAGISVLFGNTVLNYLSHVKLPGSYKNFDLDDHSYNNRFVQLLGLGEGLHNNHHYDSSNYDQAMAPGEFDPVGWFVKQFFDIGVKE